MPAESGAVSITMNFTESTFAKLKLALMAGPQGWKALVDNPEFDYSAEISDENSIQIPNPETIEAYAKRWICTFIEAKIARNQVEQLSRRVVSEVHSGMGIT